MTPRHLLAGTAAVFLICVGSGAQSQERRCDVSSVEVSAARRLPQIVGDIGIMVRGLQEARLESQNKSQACALQKRIDGKRAEEIKNFERLGDDCVVENLKVSEIRRRINSPAIHREDQCD